jgi:hypothetical protein
MDGVVGFGKEKEICEFLGIDYLKIKTEFPIPQVREDETILITTVMDINGQTESFHCMRFCRNVESEDKIIVMDPNWTERDNFLRYLDKKEFENRKCNLHKLKIDQ